MWIIKMFIETLFSPLGWIFLLPIACITARAIIDNAIAKRNAKIEYENRKQAYKDAIRELEKEKEGK